MVRRNTFIKNEPVLFNGKLWYVNISAGDGFYQLYSEARWRMSNRYEISSEFIGPSRMLTLDGPVQLVNGCMLYKLTDVERRKWNALT
jgi:hypothetical protein